MAQPLLSTPDSTQPLLVTQASATPVAQPSPRLRRRASYEFTVREDKQQKGQDWMLTGLPSVLKDQEHSINMCFDLLRKHVEQEMALFENHTKVASNSGSVTPDQEHRALVLAKCDDLEDIVVGPAVPYAYRSNAVTWAGFLLCSFAANYCTGIDDKTGLAASVFVYPQFAAFLVLLWLAFTAVPMWWEMKAFAYVLTSQVSVVGVPVLLGQRSVDRFLAILALISFLLNTDILTTAMFIARVFKSTHSCNVEWNLAWFLGADENSPLEDMWNNTVHKSSSEHGSIFEGVKFWQWTLFAWLLMICQLAYALMYSVPTSPDYQNSGYPKYVLVDGTCEAKGFPQPFRRLSSEYDTLCVAGTGHGRCLQALADSGRMITMQWLDDGYQAKAARAWTSKKLSGEMKRANCRFVLFSIQGILIPNLQIVYFGTLKARYKNAPEDPSVAFGNMFVVSSIVISVLAGANYIFWEVNTALKQVYILYTKLNKHDFERESRMEEERERRIQEQMMDGQDHIHHLHRPRTRAEWEYNKFIVWGILGMVLKLLLAISATIAFAYTLLHVVMEMMVCDALWNMPGFFAVTESVGWYWKPFHYLLHLQEGCVDLTFQEQQSHWNGGWKDCNTTYTRFIR